jgi:hypothetical protein
VQIAISIAKQSDGASVISASSSAIARLSTAIRFGVDAEIASTASSASGALGRTPKGAIGHTSMLWWLPRPRARIKRLDAQAEALICELGVDAYAEARRKEFEASSDRIAGD